ncbi:MAG TPA: prenyltransferase/squalene oxidase repeat-containing protein [Gemmataceae bacterium]|nr:prenyltransferase/squalene oxidase repeat-containing protein [Gemmataceae bacterium]
MRKTLILLLLAPTARAETPAPAPTRPDEPIAKAFSPANAAAYIDGVGLAWTRERKCATCHTNVPYMLARPKLKGGDPAPMKEVRAFLEGTVQKWETQKPRVDYEVVATAFALAGNDAATTDKLHPLTKTALDRMWTIQKPDGSWKWPDCDWPPLEHDQFYGVAFVAVALALAPDNYARTPAAQEGLKKLRTYLKANPAPELHHRATLLWASGKVTGLLSEEDKTATVADLRKLQLADGGWNLPALGPYPKRRGDIPNAMDMSDGYATGFVTFVLRQAGVPADDPAIKRAVAWLRANQRESGRWFTASAGGSKSHFITNAGSAFAILALDACGVDLKAK